MTMSPTPRVVADEIKQVLAALRDLGIVTYVNTVHESPTFVSWTTPGANYSNFLLTRDDLTVEGYLHWLETNQYSALLDDGSLLQLSYSLTAHEIVGHRLAFVPCPVVLDQGCRDFLEEGYSMSEVVRMQLQDPSNLYMKTSVRFDYDPDSAGEHHPAAHFTMNSADCRIACAAPMRVGRFLDFIFQHFYAARYQKHSYLRELQMSGWFRPTQIDRDRSSIHLNWA
jgi:hypothetical protein